MRIANCKLQSELSTVDSAMSKSFMAVGCCVSQVHRETYSIASIYLIKIAHKFIRKKVSNKHWRLPIGRMVKLKIVFRWLCAHSGYRHHVACACTVYVCRARPHTFVHRAEHKYNWICEKNFRYLLGCRIEVIWVFHVYISIRTHGKSAHRYFSGLSARICSSTRAMVSMRAHCTVAESTRMACARRVCKCMRAGVREATGSSSSRRRSESKCKRRHIRALARVASTLNSILLLFLVLPFLLSRSTFIHSDYIYYFCFDTKTIKCCLSNVYRRAVGCYIQFSLFSLFNPLISSSTFWSDWATADQLFMYERWCGSCLGWSKTSFCVACERLWNSCSQCVAVSAI